jgi:type I restriction enzyme R subunit
MKTSEYTEDMLVERPAIRLFAELGWHIACCNPQPQPFSHREKGDKIWVDETGLFGRETKGEVVLASRLRNSLTRLNPGLPPETINAAVDELIRDRSAMSLGAANRRPFYRSIDVDILLDTKPCK